MKLNMEEFYICWSPRILSILYDEGFELWVDPAGSQQNPYLDIKKRFNKDGTVQSQKTGYIFERTPELMELVGKHSRRQV